MIAIAELIGMGGTALLADTVGPVVLLDAAALAMLLDGALLLLVPARYEPESMSDAPRWPANVSSAD